MTEFSYCKAAPLLLVGAGNMGGALARGWLAAGLSPDALLIIDPALAEAGTKAGTKAGLDGVTIVASVAGVAPGTCAASLVMAVKPQMMDEALADLASLVAGDTLIISIAAGTPIAKFESVFKGCAVVRAMPNTPAAVGKGISGLVANGHCSKDHKEQAAALLSAVGGILWLDSEELINAVTATSGSGPAYVFYMVESLAAAGVANGLDEDTAMTLARQTVIGSAHLMAESPSSAAELRRQVTSPNGTTAAALDILMAEDGMQRLLRRAVTAARRRARDLAEK